MELMIGRGASRTRKEHFINLQFPNSNLGLRTRLSASKVPAMTERKHQPCFPGHRVKKRDLAIVTLAGYNRINCHPSPNGPVVCRGPAATPDGS